jgi:hypothetical protein
MGNLKDPPGLFMSLKAGVTLTKVNAGQEVPPKLPATIQYDEFGGYDQHKLSAPHRHRRRERVQFQLVYTTRSARMDQRCVMQAAAPLIQNLCRAKLHHRLPSF